MGLGVSFQKGRASARAQNVPEVKAGGELPGDAPTPAVLRASEEALRPPRPAPEPSIRAVGFSFLKRDPQAHPSGIFIPFGVRNLSYITWMYHFGKQVFFGGMEKAWKKSS